MEMRKSKGQKNATQTKSPKKKKSRNQQQKKNKRKHRIRELLKNKKRKEVKRKRHTPPMAERQKHGARRVGEERQSQKNARNVTEKLSVFAL